MPLFLLIALFFLQAPLFAATNPFLIINRTSDLDPNVPLEKTALDALNSAADSIENSVNTTFLSDSSQQNFTTGMAQAGVSNTAGILVDRASNPQRFSIAAAAQGNVYQLTSKAFETNNSLPTAGAGAQALVSVGLNASKIGISKIGFLDGRRLMIYFNGGGLSKTISKATVSFLDFGIEAQYKIIEPKGGLFFGWGGLDTTIGLNYGKNTVQYSANINQSGTTTVSGQTATVNLNMDYSLGINSWDFFIPVEVSTNVNLFYLFSLFAGGGVDFNFGKSELTGTASGPVNASYSQATGAANIFSGTGSLNLDDGISGKPSFAVARGFCGLQLNLSVLKIVFEGHALSNGTQGGGVILRAAL